MSPILGDALINSRWWLISHRRNLHSGDHRQQATTTVLLDRGGGLEEEKLMGFNQFHLPGTTAASGNCLLLPTAGGSLRQNPGKIGRLIQSVRKVISVPARFRDRGARWLVVRLYVLKQLEKTKGVFWGINGLRLESLQESRTSKMLCRTYSVFSEEIC